MTDRDLALVAGLADPVLSNRQFELLARYRLIDRGDHVEWSDGATVKRWRLRDQSAAAESLPILDSVVRLRSRSAVVPTSRFAIVRTVYCAPDGRFLGYATAKPFWSKDLADRCYPRRVFATLEARGVPFIVEDPITVERLEKAHPGISENKLLSLYRRHAFLVIVAVFAAILAIVEIMTFASS